MAKHKLLNYAFLAGTLSLFTVACQPTPTAIKPNQASPVSGTGGGFSKKDWPATGFGYRPTEIQALNLQLSYSGSTRNPGGHNITMSTGLVAGEPQYSIELSGYKLDASGKQYATRGFFHFTGNAINGYDASGGVSKYIGMAMVANLESTDGVHFRLVTTSGHMNGYYTTPDTDQHGNMNGACQYYEHTAVPIKLDPNSLLTLDEANKTFSLHVPFSGLPGTVSRGLSPWLCAYNCSPGGAYNEQCDSQITANGALDMSGKLVYTAPTEIQLRAEPDIFSTALGARGSTSIYFSQHDWAQNQIWRFTMPPYEGQPYIVEGVVPFLVYPHPLNGTLFRDWQEYGWYGQKGWTTYTDDDGFSWQDYDYYQDGTYHFEVISDRHQRATTTVRIDSTKPDFSEPDLKILPDGRRQISVTVKDPIVNGVRAGLDAGMFSQMLLWTEGGAWGNVQAKQVDDNTVRVVGEYMPNPIPTPTPQPTVYPSWSPSASSSPTYDASGNPNPGYSGNPGPTPHPTPTPWQDPDELLDDSTQIYFEFLAKDKVHNPRNFAIELNPSNLKLLLNERYFSPNDDGRKDTVAFRVEDAAPTEDWVLQIKSGGAVVREFTGQGSQNLLWDGKNSSGQSQAEGKYNLVLTSKKQGGWRKSQSIRSVWIDLTPPDIQFEYINKKLKVVYDDRLSGLDYETLNTSFNTEIGFGGGVVKNLSNNNKRASLLFDFMVTSPVLEISMGQFGIQNLPNPLLIYFAIAQGFDMAGNLADVKVPPPFKGNPIPKSGDCTSSGGRNGRRASRDPSPNFEVIDVYDFDKTDADVTVVVRNKFYRDKYSNGSVDTYFGDRFIGNIRAFAGDDTKDLVQFRNEGAKVEGSLYADSILFDSLTDGLYNDGFHNSTVNYQDPNKPKNLFFKTVSPSVANKIPRLGNLSMARNEGLNLISLNLKKFRGAGNVTVNIELWNAERTIKNTLKLSFVRNSKGGWEQVICI